MLQPRQRLKASDTLQPGRWIPTRRQVFLRRPTCQLDMGVILGSFGKWIPLQQNKQMP